MAKTFTPVIGLAVVVALALAAVFGSMSLANPVAAQTVGAAICTGAGFIPNQGVALGESERYDVGACFEGTTAATGVRSSDPSIATAALGSGDADGNATTAGDIYVTGVKVGMVNIEVVTASSGQKSFQLEVYNTGPTAKGTIPAQSVGTENQTQTVDLSKYFDGADITYVASSSNPANVSVLIGNVADDGAFSADATGMHVQVTQVGSAGSSVTVTVTATNPVDATGAKQTFMVHIDGAPEVLVEDADATPDGAQVDLRALREGATRVIDLTDYFSGDRNSYTVHASGAGGAVPTALDNLDNLTDFASNSVGAEVEGTTLTLTGKSRGLTTNVLVVATSGGGADGVVLRITVSRTASPERTGEGLVIDVTGLPSFSPGSTSPGSGTSYTVKFQADGAVNTRQSDLEIEFDGDYGIPSSIRNTSVAITTEGGTYTSDSGDVATSRTFTPEDVTVDGETVLISLGDMDEHDDRIDYDIDNEEVITVLFRQSAGITNPTEAKGYNLVKISFGAAADIEYNDATEDDLPGLNASIIRKISLDADDGGLGDVVTATGKGFKDKTSLTVFRDKVILVMWDDDGDEATVAEGVTPTARVKFGTADAKMIPESMVKMYEENGGNVPWIPTNDDGSARHVDPEGYVWAPSATLDQNEDVLCVVAAIDGSDIGKCEFTINHPTFEGGNKNYVNAKDGRGTYATEGAHFVLEASISASPAAGSPGERILVQMVDFPPNTTVGEVLLARNEDDPIAFSGGGIDSTGSGTLSFTIPNWPSAGTQELKVFGANDVDASQNITITGPSIQVNPASVLANQRVSLIGTGFSPGAVIANDTDSGKVVDHVISIGGKVVTGDRINDGDAVRVDNGGNWSASVDLPLSEATTAEGQRILRVTDSRARTGGEEVTIPARSVTITPDTGRVGTIAVVRGEGFPSKNDEGSSFSIEIEYDASNGNSTRVSATPDASGRFEVQLRIPTTAAIPSSNTVKVRFEDDDDIVVPLTIPHEVPEGIITTSESSGGPGSSVTVNGEGFKSFVPISLVRIGALDVTPSPKPSTDGNGMMNFDITIPGLDVGIQTIEVHVGRTTSSVGFTVTESGLNPGDIKAVAEAIEELGDNLVSVWHFNNDTKVWAFYDPTLAEGNTLTHMISGETYLIRVKSTVEVILNRDTRNLTCVGTNCWNQQVW